jgi:hypothetical protein
MLSEMRGSTSPGLGGKLEWRAYELYLGQCPSWDVRGSGGSCERHGDGAVCCRHAENADRRSMEDLAVLRGSSCSPLTALNSQP